MSEVGRNFKYSDSTKFLFKIELPGTEEKLIFVPYYQIYDYRYGIYLQWQKKDSPQAIARENQIKQVREYRQRIVGQLTNFDQNNWEYAQHLQAEHSTIGYDRGKRYRRAEANGYFSYEFNLEEAKPGLTLQLTLSMQDRGQTIEVNLDNQIEKRIKIMKDFAKKDKDGFFIVNIPVPNKLLNDEKLSLRFSNDAEQSARIWGITLINRKKQENGKI